MPAAPQKLHHDTNKPQQAATPISRAIPNKRYMSHRALVCTPPGALSGVLFREALWLHKARGATGPRCVVVSTRCNTGTLKTTAPE